MSTYYRLSQDETLPSNWAYGDPDDGTMPGFQVWITIGEAVRALAGEDLDGLYPVEEYPVFFSVVTSQVEDGGNLWFAVRLDWIRELRSMPSSQLLEWVCQQVNAGDVCDLDSLAGWLEDDRNQRKVARYVKKHSTVVHPKFRDNL